MIRQAKQARQGQAPPPGNSGGRVAVQRYPLSDSRIVGYGVLNWKTGKETTE